LLGNARDKCSDGIANETTGHKTDVTVTGVVTDERCSSWCGHIH